MREPVHGVVDKLDGGLVGREHQTVVNRPGPVNEGYQVASKVVAIVKPFLLR